jgi:(p)ppGpp synthase/HD superfamily hydrolase
MAQSHLRGADLSFLQDLPLARDAVDFASERHAGQRREGDGAEFILHPIEVAALLERSGCPDYVVAAAILHDVLEDTDAERADLESRFGPEIADLDQPVLPDRHLRELAMHVEPKARARHCLHLQTIVDR